MRLGRATAVAIVLTAIITLVFGLLNTRSAHAAVFTVNSGADTVDASIGDGVCATATGNCTLRAAVQEANATTGVDAITFSANSVTLSSNGGSEDAAATGDLDITQDATIDGGSGGVTIGADPNFNDRIIHIASSAKATVKNLTITGGDQSAGGGIFVRNSAALDLSSSTVQQNVARDSSDYGSAYGGGIMNNGTLTITKSTIYDNYSETTGSVGTSSGGGLFNAGTATITDSTFDANYTISSPTATPSTGGGGIHNNSGTLTLTNDTISGNTTYGYGKGSGIQNYDTVRVTNATFYDNNSYFNDGTYLPSIHNGWGSNFYVRNTVVANSVDRFNCLSEPESSIHSQGNNLEYPSTSCGFTGTNDIQNQDPRLGPLASNGGPTKTHALLPGSPAIDAGTNIGCPATDQRGITRPQDGDNDGSATCDIGALEVDATAPNTSIDNGPSGTINVTSATFEFSSNEPGSTFRCSLDSVFFTSCSSPKTYMGLGDGPHVFRVYARDAVGNEDQSPAERTFTVDTTAPTVTSVTPVDGALKVLRGTNVTADFSEAIDPATLTNNVALTNVNTGAQVQVQGTVTLTPDGKTVTLDPSATLAKRTRYEARIRGGTGGVEDLAGNPLAADKVWSFTTGAK
jgi:CSLREA domain-containing protein